ncbi:MAG: response regulator, partial [Oceanospirillaceae bacterium]|nr:response regulator [Oceanospirillaceae bacterium]
AAIPVALQGKRILFAEDQKTLQLLTSKVLKDAGAEVVVCDNGKQALDAFRAGEFDIVLTDLMMPEMSGDELIRHIRADGFTGQVVALTAAIIGKETEQLMEAGADAVLNKPLDIHDMKRTIAGLEIKDSVA